MGSEFTNQLAQTNMGYIYGLVLIVLRHQQVKRCPSFGIVYTEPAIEGSTHWGRVRHICVSDLTIIGSDNGLSPGWRQAIIWTNDGKLLIGPLGTNFSENLVEYHTFSFKKMYMKISSAKGRPFCPGGDELKLPVSCQGNFVHWHWTGVASVVVCLIKLH